ncbi:Heat shock protein E [Serratia fonticola]|uniref:fimbria/pilus outer membrane usher protein n=1 Tax=Serratia fonticola TaxID=47917 RepID=UPI00218380E3|nr:fimbria/pilus outer membrane usher protein [Serratia fonticola]CAI2530252.1 Heat shock protein E [Serratia fonticola]
MTRCKPTIKTVLKWLLSCAMVSATSSYAADTPEEVTFDPSFFPGGKVGTFDPAQFSRSNVVVPGIYTVAIELNGQRIGNEKIQFKAQPGNNLQTLSCYPGSFFSLLNLSAEKLLAQIPAVQLAPLVQEGYCGSLSELLPGATVSFDVGEQKLTLTIPQLLLNRTPHGYVNPELWEDGLTALIVNYNANVYQSRQRENSNTYGYLGLRNGLNFGPWRVRNNGSINWSSGESGGDYKSTSSYISRDVTALQSQLILGDAFTSGELFDGIRFRGARLYSDDRMLPDALRGYAPVVRGIANTNARVIITQNGYTLYTTTVSPGPFEINDLYPTSYGGELTVQVEEANGQVRTFTVPYASVTQMLRPGISRYEVAAGKVNSDGLANKPEFGSLTYQLGLSNFITGYTGATASKGYLSALLGGAMNTFIGALSLDVTQAKTRLPGQHPRSGQSYRIGFSQMYPETQTSFSVAAYRYSTDGFLSLNDAVQLRDLALRNGNIDAYGRQRSLFTLSVNQQLGEGWGSLYATGNHTSYWNQSSSQQSLQLGYSNFWRNLSYTLSVNRTLSGQLTGNTEETTADQRETQYALTLSLPLGSNLHAPTLNATGTTDDKGSTGLIGLSGNAGEQNQFNYVVSTSRNTEGNSNFFNGGVGYRSSLAHMGANYSYGQGNRQVSASIDGALVAHRGGITLGQSLGETGGLVRAPGAEGALVTGAPGVQIDRFGYAIVPYLRPYYLNQVDIDPKGSSQDVELLSTRNTTAPRAGALVLLDYETKRGKVTYIRAKRPDGSPLPFAANVYDAQNNAVGVVGQASLVVARDLDLKGMLQVRWGDSQAEHCSIHYSLQPGTSVDSRQLIQGVCQ